MFCARSTVAVLNNDKKAIQKVFIVDAMYKSGHVQLSSCAKDVSRSIPAIERDSAVALSVTITVLYTQIAKATITSGGWLREGGRERDGRRPGWGHLCAV